MKFFYFSIIIVSLFVAVSLPHVTFGQSLQSGSDTLEYYFGNSTITHIDHDGASIIVKPIYNKTSFKIGEKITIIPSLVNVGNKSITVSYLPLLFFYEIKDQSGHVAWLHLEDAGHVLKMPDTSVLLQPNLPHVAADKYVENMPVLYTPGKYDILSMAYFKLDGSVPYTSLWSKPLQITVLPEKYVEPHAQTPSGQFESGVPSKDIKCKKGTAVILHPQSIWPACVKPDTATVLMTRGWAKPV